MMLHNLQYFKNNQDVLTKPKMPYFDRNTTGIIKGIALIMMFVHHFFTFPGWWINGISYPLIAKISVYFCFPLKLCVPVFCFISGYFYYFNKNKSFKYSFKKISDILISYWVAFFLLAIIAVLFVKYKWSFWDFISECFALNRPTMCFCWYVSFYIVFMLLLPLIIKLFSKNIFIDLFLSIILIPNIFHLIDRFANNWIISELAYNQYIFLPCVLIGYVFANYRLFETIDCLNFRLIKNWKLNVALMLIIAVSIPFCNYKLFFLNLKLSNLPTLTINMNVIYAPIFIYSIVYICKYIDIKGFKKVLAVIGKYSLLMWFISCIFFNTCANVFQPILYFPHNPILVTIWGLIICLAISFVLNKIIKTIQIYKNKLLKL